MAGCLPENNCQESWHKVAKRNIEGLLRGSTKRCLEVALPRLTILDGIRMPRRISFALKCVSSGTLEKAKETSENADKTIFSDTDNEYFVLRLSSKYKAIDKALVTKYRSMMEGDVPAGTPVQDKGKRWKACLEIAQSMRRVTLAKKHSIPESKHFNPFKFECRCFRS